MPDQARLYFYRGLAPYGTMIWTAVYLNGAHIGDSGPAGDGVTFRPVPRSRSACVAGPLP